MSLPRFYRPSERFHPATIWYDGKILPGQDWEYETDTHLNEADIIVLLITASFLAWADYFWEKKMSSVLERCKAGEARVVPVIMSPCLWKESPISEFQVLPPNGKPLSTWRNRDSAFLEVVKGIVAVIDEVRSKRVQNTDEPS